MIIDVLTLFPEMFEALNSSIIKRASEKGIIEIRVHNFRDYSKKNSRQVDDYSYGGGAGMIQSLQALVDCLRSIPGYETAHKILTAPVGKVYSQSKASEFSKLDHLIILCGHYEGIDDRIEHFVDEEISVGDYVLSGGEIPAFAIIDSVVRLLPGALGNEESTDVESFGGQLLEYPQYTRPEVFEGLKVPDVLISGDHEKVRKFRRFQSLERTYHRRPDLLAKAELTAEDLKFLEKIKRGEQL